MKRDLRLVPNDCHQKRGLFSHFMKEVLWFIRNEVPEYLSRIITYGWSAFWILRLVKLENIDTLLMFLLLLISLTYAVGCSIMFEGLYLLRDRNNLQIGSVRHFLIPVFSIIWPLTLCFLILAIADYLIRSYLEDDDDDDDDDGDREDVPKLQVV